MLLATPHIVSILLRCYGNHCSRQSKLTSIVILKRLSNHIRMIQLPVVRPVHISRSRILKRVQFCVYRDNRTFKLWFHIWMVLLVAHNINDVDAPLKSSQNVTENIWTNTWCLKSYARTIHGKVCLQITAAHFVTNCVSFRNGASRNAFHWLTVTL